MALPRLAGRAYKVSQGRKFSRIKIWQKLAGVVDPDSDPDPSVKNSKKNLDFYCFATFL
jgi:hypothetical protein